MGLVSPVVDYGHFCMELEGLQELDYEKSVNYGRALGSEEAPSRGQNGYGLLKRHI